ncbi:MAG: DEAD/DEAH box helicase [Lachnospiraceae bacterium]|nr:DEAD/DEAH box helicase [Lachnospiraceae bacterium]
MEFRNFLNKTFIKSYAQSDEVYADGFSYYKNGRVTHAVASKDKTVYQFTVKGNYNYKVTVRLGDTLDCTCTCANLSKNHGICKHIIASLLFLGQFERTTKATAELTAEEQRNGQILDYYGELESGVSQGETAHVELTFFYRGILRQPSDTIAMRISMGSGRYYKVQSVKKMLEAVRSGQNVTLGKNFTYRRDICEFDASSARVVEYLCELSDLEDRFQIVGEKSVFQKNEVMLGKSVFLEILRRLDGDPCSLVFSNRMIEGVTFSDGNPYISYDIDAGEDYVSLGYADNSRVFPLAADGSLLFYDRVIYHPSASFTKNYLPIYNSLSRDGAPMFFRGDYAKRFLEDVLPKLSNTMNMDIPAALAERYVSYPLSATLYVDYVNYDIRGELRFTYGEYSFNSFAEPDVRSIILVRDKEAEQEILTCLKDLGFESHNGYYLLRDVNGIFDFISGNRGKLDEMCTLMYSDSFRSLRISRGEHVTYGVHMKSDEDYLTLDISYDDVPKKELADIFRSIKLKKKYYRMKDGNFLLLDSDAVQQSMQFLRSLSGLSQPIREDGVVIDRSQVCYLEQMLRHLGSEYRMDDSIYELLDILNHPPMRECPEGITADVRPYQMVGYSWMCNLAEHHMGGILADDMGLGKTLQAILFLSTLPENSRRMVVCPTSLMYNWKDEFENFAPKLTCEVICGTPEERRKLIHESTASVFITSYPLIRRDLSHYKDMEFSAVIIDEAQNIKNSSSMNALSVKNLKTKTRFALTGTPIENSLSEIWSIFDFVMPGYLFSHSKFVNEYEKPIMNQDNEILSQLNLRIQPYVMRRMKQDVLSELPEKTEEKILVDLSERQKKLYAAYLEHYKGEFGFDDEEGEEVPVENRIRILSALMRLRQICCHPATFMDNYDGDSAKMDVLLDLLEEAKASGHRTLVFSQFTSMLDLIEKELEARGIGYFCIRGDTKIADRSEYVKQFNEGTHSVFLISLKAGGTGLNLIGADTVIHVDPWWNPAVEDQATDRCYRIGQTRNVHVIKLLSKGTIEEKIYRLQRKKQKLAEAVIERQEDLIGKLTRQELIEIFS